MVEGSSGSRARYFALTVLALGLLAALLLGWTMLLRMPGRSHSGEPSPLSPSDELLREELRGHVEKLAGEIGERNLPTYEKLVAAADYVESSLTTPGYQVQRLSYEVGDRRADNIEAERAGSREIVVIGAHYDSVFGSPGANDNASGVAALLALSRRFAAKTSARTLRFVAFTNEEPPYFQTRDMGSYVYAGACRARGDNIVAMISLETIGYFSDEKRSQVYPIPGLGLAYPRTGNFIGFVANPSSRHLLRQVLRVFRTHAAIPSEGAALPAAVPGVGWSDQWAFWQHGYPGVMVTDTAPFRYPHYHEASDTPDKLSYDGLTRVVLGMEKVIEALVN